MQPGYPSKKPSFPDVGLIVNVGSQVGLALIGIIFVALIVGLGIDELLQLEKHPFTVLLFLVSAPFSLIVTYWLVRRATKDLNSQKPAGEAPKPAEEEGKRG